jgi:hypothetical protein
VAETQSRKSNDIVTRDSSGYATRLLDGRILITGGYDDVIYNAQKTAELGTIAH